MSRLTRDGTAEPVSRDQILRHERGQGNIIFPCSADHEQDGNFTRLIYALAICVTIHACASAVTRQLPNNCLSVSSFFVLLFFSEYSVFLYFSLINYTGEHLERILSGWRSSTL